MSRFKQRPSGSTWGDFSEDDEIGRLNLLDQQKVLQAAKEIRTGNVFCLSLPLDLPGGNGLRLPHAQHRESANEAARK